MKRKLTIHERFLAFSKKSNRGPSSPAPTPARAVPGPSTSDTSPSKAQQQEKHQPPEKESALANSSLDPASLSAHTPDTASKKNKSCNNRDGNHSTCKSSKNGKNKLIEVTADAGNPLGVFFVTDYNVSPSRCKVFSIFKSGQLGDIKGIGQGTKQEKNIMMMNK